jgi:hypothetical protein
VEETLAICKSLNEQKAEIEAKCEALQLSLVAKEQAYGAQQVQLQEKVDSQKSQSVSHRAKVIDLLCHNKLNFHLHYCCLSSLFGLFLCVRNLLLCCLLTMQVVFLLFGIWIMMIAVIYEHIVDFHPNTISPYRITS